MPGRLTLGLLTLRALGIGALLLLLVNPAVGHLGAPSSEPPLVLLDASLSMAGQWRAALDTARRLGKGGVVWRFGDVVTPFDTTAPADGASRVGPALAAAAARGGPIVIVTDGEVTDLQEVSADLRRRARVILLPRRPVRDAFVSALEAPRRVSLGDTVRIEVAYGVAGPSPRTPRGAGPRERLVVEEGGRRLLAVPVSVPDSGIVTTDLVVPVAGFPAPGFHVLTVRLEGAADSEPRDDARQLVIEVSAQPSVVVLADPPDWESRFLAKALEDVARVPVRVYDRTEAGSGGQWREGRTLAPVAPAAVMRDVQAARFVALVGDPQRLATFQTRGGTAVLSWNTVAATTGDWYVGGPAASPLEADLAGISWDSLPPVSAGGSARVQDSTQTPVLSARLGRRGNAMPIVLLQEARGRGRRITVAATGLWRWAFRGGAAEQAYRGLIAALANWLLERGAGGDAAERVFPVSREVPNGVPLRWRWSAGGSGRAAPPAAGVRVVLTDPHGIAHADTLRFDAAGEAQVRLPPGEYRYDIDGARGVVVVEAYSDEWRPSAPVLSSQPGLSIRPTAERDWRNRWWLFGVAMLAFTGEWVWRRRQGLP